MTTKRVWLQAAAWALLACLPAAAQEGPDAPEAEKEGEGLTYEKAVGMLREIEGLMKTSEELLDDSSRGKALETEQQLAEKLKELLKEDEKEDPALAQKKVLEKIDRLMKKSEKSQKGAVEGLAEMIRKARTSPGQDEPKPRPGKPKPPPKSAKPPQQPGSPAPAPYDPNRNDPVNTFRSRAERPGRWGDLPPRLREAILSGKRDLDEYPAEYRELLKEYMKKLSEEKE